MDTTENKTEHFIKKPYPEFKPAKEGAYMTDYGLSFWAGRGWLRELKPIEPEYFFEPSPMEVKDVITKQYPAMCGQCLGKGYIKNPHKSGTNIDIVCPVCKGNKSIIVSEFSQLQPPVISADEFLKEKGIDVNEEIMIMNSGGVCMKVVDICLEFLQRQGQKTNQNKL